MPNWPFPKSKPCLTANSVSRNRTSLNRPARVLPGRAVTSQGTSVAGAASPVVCLYGKGVARGYAIGRAVVMGAAALEVAHYRIAPEDIAAESSRLTQALADAQQELLLLADTLPADAPRELGAMLNVHSLLLGDPLLAEQTLALIAERHYNAEWALTTQGPDPGPAVRRHGRRVPARARRRRAPGHRARAACAGRHIRHAAGHGPAWTATKP